MSEDSRVWIVGHKSNPEISNPVLGFAWDFVGVYDSQDRAIRACFSESYFYFYMALNTGFGGDAPVWIKEKTGQVGEV